MDINLSFLGAAQNVTGSRYLLEVNGSRILVDCGLYQERQFRERNWDPFPVEPGGIDTILLTHAHLDHCGYLPRLVRDGFSGKIYCTQATAEIARIILLDSAKLQVEDARYKAKRHKKEGRKGRHPEQELYNVEDAQASLSQFHPLRYTQPVDLGNGIEASFYDAGHILGASMIKVTVRSQGEKRTILFSGDIGRWDSI
jgi:metallo-beta-lactamase family protein